MYPNYQYNPSGFNNINPNVSNEKVQFPNQQFQNDPMNPNDDRLVGGFAFPFLLGGVTGAALAPAFWRPGYPNYNYRPAPYYPYQYPYYGPYYR